MTNEELGALIDDAVKECNRIDNQNMRFGLDGASALLGVMAYVIAKYPPNSLMVRAARAWIENRAMEWRARNENSN